MDWLFTNDKKKYPSKEKEEEGEGTNRTGPTFATATPAITPSSANEGSRPLLDSFRSVGLSFNFSSGSNLKGAGGERDPAVAGAVEAEVPSSPSSSIRRTGSQSDISQADGDGGGGGGLKLDEVMTGFLGALQSDLETGIDELKESSASFTAMFNKALSTPTIPSTTVPIVDPAREEARSLLSRLKLEAEGGDRQVVMMAKAGDRLLGMPEDEAYIRLEWYRAAVGGSFTEIKGVRGGVYRPSADDIGARISIRGRLLGGGNEGGKTAMPRGPDGTKLEVELPYTVYSEIGPSALDPETEQALHHLLEKSEVRFLGLREPHNPYHVYDLVLHAKEGISLWVRNLELDNSHSLAASKEDEGRVADSNIKKGVIDGGDTEQHRLQGKEEEGDEDGGRSSSTTTSASSRGKGGQKEEKASNDNTRRGMQEAEKEWKELIGEGGYSRKTLIALHPMSNALLIVQLPLAPPKRCATATAAAQADSESEDEEEEEHDEGLQLLDSSLGLVTRTLIAPSRQQRDLMALIWRHWRRDSLLTASTSGSDVIVDDSILLDMEELLPKDDPETPLTIDKSPLQQHSLITTPSHMGAGERKRGGAASSSGITGGTAVREGAVDRNCSASIGTREEGEGGARVDGEGETEGAFVSNVGSSGSTREGGAVSPSPRTAAVIASLLASDDAPSSASNDATENANATSRAAMLEGRAKKGKIKEEGKDGELLVDKKKLQQLLEEVERERELRAQAVMELKEIEVEPKLLRRELVSVQSKVLQLELALAKATTNEANSRDGAEEAAVRAQSLEEEVGRLRRKEQALLLKMSRNEEAVTVLKEELSQLNEKFNELQAEKETERAFLVQGLRDGGVRLERADSALIDQERELKDAKDQVLWVEEQMRKLDEDKQSAEQEAYRLRLSHQSTHLLPTHPATYLPIYLPAHRPTYLPVQMEAQMRRLDEDKQRAEQEAYRLRRERRELQRRDSRSTPPLISATSMSASMSSSSLLAIDTTFNTITPTDNDVDVSRPGSSAPLLVAGGATAQGEEGGSAGGGEGSVSVLPRNVFPMIEMEEWEKKTQEAEARSAIAEQKVKELGEELKEAQRKLQHTQTALDGERAHTSALVSERNSLRHKADSLAREMSRINRLGRSLDEIDEMFVKYNELQGQVSVFKAKNTRLQEELEEVKGIALMDKSGGILSGLNLSLSRVRSRSNSNGGGGGLGHALSRTGSNGGSIGGLSTSQAGGEGGEGGGGGGLLNGLSLSRSRSNSNMGGWSPVVVATAAPASGTTASGNSTTAATISSGAITGGGGSPIAPSDSRSNSITNSSSKAGGIRGGGSGLGFGQLLQRMGSCASHSLDVAVLGSSGAESRDVAELSRLVTSLTESLHDKDMQLKTQRQMSRLLAGRLSKLEKLIRDSKLIEGDLWEDEEEEGKGGGDDDVEEEEEEEEVVSFEGRLLGLSLSTTAI